MSQQKFAVFDIDGTLLRWQLYHAVINSLAKEGLLGPDAYQAIKAARLTWKNRTDSEAFKAYENLLIKTYEQGLSHHSFADFERTAHVIIGEYKDQVYAYTRDLVKSLKEQGYFLLAISGSHHEIVGLLAKEYGFDDYVGSTYEHEDGKYTGNKNVASHDKAKHLHAFVEKHNLTMQGSVAVGDSFSDVAMLELVENPIAFNPEANLYNHAKEEGWKIVVERKNVVYELTRQGSSYQLS